MTREEATAAVREALSWVEGEALKYGRRALRAVLTVERAIRLTAAVGASTAAVAAIHHGLVEIAAPAMASAIVLADAGLYQKAVETVKKTAERLYEELRDVWERLKVTLEQLVHWLLEALARFVRDHWALLMAAVAAGVIALEVALNIGGMIGQNGPRRQDIGDRRLGPHIRQSENTEGRNAGRVAHHSRKLRRAGSREVAADPRALGKGIGLFARKAS